MNNYRVSRMYRVTGARQRSHVREGVTLSRPRQSLLRGRGEAPSPGHVLKRRMNGTQSAGGAAPPPNSWSLTTHPRVTVSCKFQPPAAPVLWPHPGACTKSRCVPQSPGQAARRGRCPWSALPSCCPKDALRPPGPEDAGLADGLLSALSTEPNPGPAWAPDAERRVELFSSFHHR